MNYVMSQFVYDTLWRSKASNIESKHRLFLYRVGFEYIYNQNYVRNDIIINIFKYLKFL